MNDSKNRRIRVALVIPTMDQGGAEKQMTLLACHLDRQQFESHVVLLTRSGPLEQTLRDAGVHVAPLPMDLIEDVPYEPTPAI